MLAMTTQPSGSVIIASIGRGDKSLFVIPTDNKGNSPYHQEGIIHPYDPNYPNSGTAMYSFVGARGGAGYQLTTSTSANDEITVAAVEVVEASAVRAAAWVELPDADLLTSATVTTTKAATLIAFWWGDGFPHTPQTATPGDGFFEIDTNAYETDSFVQCAVAVKNVSQAGTYSVSWTSTPKQGAQLWLVAVE
jgi:hypothetical protein